MKDYINIGSSPFCEGCAQVGSDGYETRAGKECETFIQQIRRDVGPEPKGARLRTKSFPHDFGSYKEVVCEYDEDVEGSLDYAYKVESGCPENWDHKSREFLGLNR